jgi:transglutaminase-like putative cysteine protease
MSEMINTAYLAPTEVVDFDNPAVKEYADVVVETISSTDDVDIAVALYQRVRDDILYNPYVPYHRKEAYMASLVVANKKGYCVSKAVLLCALGRYCGIPSRLGFATVRNHIATKQLIDTIGSNVFAYHGYTELYLNNKWVKATPAFDKLTCARHRVSPLEFDGKNDSLYQEYNLDKNMFMEYLEFHGSYADVPIDKIIMTFRKTYGDTLVNRWITAFEAMRGLSQRRFENEKVVH